MLLEAQALRTFLKVCPWTNALESHLLIRVRLFLGATRPLNENPGCGDGRVWDLRVNKFSK